MQIKDLLLNIHWIKVEARLDGDKVQFEIEADRGEFLSALSDMGCDVPESQCSDFGDSDVEANETIKDILTNDFYVDCGKAEDSGRSFVPKKRACTFTPLEDERRDRPS